ncbi:hypothetical protein L210DRAFT_3507211 [Boletus edulis BED1]|uniref:Uncharacterized protein n=1 Tax=Boletus edulis BED1 TaxID=1328754 RepID=A0AAD4BKZ4_BOLED|nr:hypothetical protein L210DRAFT_3507211 [Boletus edulis BED1]
MTPGHLSFPYGTIPQPQFTHGHHFELASQAVLLPTIAQSASRSTSYSLSTSASIRDGSLGDDRIRKSELLAVNKQNVEFAADFLILEAALTGNWNKLLNQMQLFHSKMAKASETYAEMYDLHGSIDFDGTLEPFEVSLAVQKQCKAVTFPENWSIYYLHEYDHEMLVTSPVAVVTLQATKNNWLQPVYSHTPYLV